MQCGAGYLSIHSCLAESAFITPLQSELRALCAWRRRLRPPWCWLGSAQRGMGRPMDASSSLGAFPRESQQLPGSRLFTMLRQHGRAHRKVRRAWGRAFAVDHQAMAGRTLRRERRPSNPSRPSATNAALPGVAIVAAGRT